MDPQLRLYLAYATFGLIPRIHGKAMDSFDKAWQEYRKAQERNKNAREVSNQVSKMAEEALDELVHERLRRERVNVPKKSGGSEEPT